MLKVGQIEQVEITGYSSEGMGVCRMEGCAVFVPNAIRGEVCDVKVTHVSRNSAHGTIQRLHTRSPHRITRLCPDAKLCGGCQLQHMDYAEELRFKAQKVADALTRIGGQSLPLAKQATGNRQYPKGHRQATGDGGCGSFDSGCASAQDDPVGAVIGRPQSLPPANEATGNRQQAAETVARAICPPDQPTDNTLKGTGVQEATEKAFPLGGRWPAGPDEGTSDKRAVPITGAADIGSYRNKAQYPLAMKNGKPVAGFYKNRTHEVIPIRRCAILPAVFDQVKDVLLRWAEEDRVSVYDETTGKGLLRHLYVRKGAISGQIMVCIVANGRQLPRENRLIHVLRREIPGLASVILSVNTRNTNVVLGEEFRTLWGQDWIEDQLCGFSFRLSPRSFYQVNHDQAQRLYEKAVELAELHGTETVLDLYCGTGTITLALSRKAGRAIGVEIVPQAIADAKENAARNGVTNAEFFCADAAEVAAHYAQRGTAEASGDERDGFLASLGMTGPDVIVVDPPRKGLAPEVVDAMVQMAPARIVYVSCDPATLARDVKLFSANGYALTHAEAFDLFPRTFHVETVVLLRRKNMGAST